MGTPAGQEAGEETRSQEVRVYISALPFTDCETLGMLLPFSGLVLSLAKWRWKSLPYSPHRVVVRAKLHIMTEKEREGQSETVSAFCNYSPYNCMQYLSFNRIKC